MVDAKQAVKMAMEYLNEMYDTKEFKDVMLEEVELSEDNRYWNVTIGFARRQVSTSEGPMASLVGKTEQYKREFKIFTIDAKNGIEKLLEVEK